jgi:rhodanese-related sulfurtransferase
MRDSNSLHAIRRTVRAKSPRSHQLRQTRAGVRLIFDDQNLFSHLHHPSRRLSIHFLLPRAQIAAEWHRLPHITAKPFGSVILDADRIHATASNTSIFTGILTLMPEVPAPPLPPEIAAEAYLTLRDSASPAPILLDVREPWEFQTAALPNSLLMPMGEVTSRAHTELDPDDRIIVLCHHGQRSLSVAMWLRNQGFDHAQSLAGGIDYWSRAIDPAIPRY